jgi:hypothetical protein
MPLILDDRERVVSAWGERCSGPAWANQPVWVLICTAAGGYRLEAIQPQDQTPAMRALFNVSAAAAEEMRRAVEAR